MGVSAMEAPPSKPGVFVAIIGFKVAEYRAEQATFVEAPAVEEEVEEKSKYIATYFAIYDGNKEEPDSQ